MQICMLNQKVDSPSKHLSNFKYFLKNTNPFEPRNTQVQDKSYNICRTFFDVGSQTSHEEQTNANHDTPRPLRPHIPVSVKFGESKEILILLHHLST